LAADDADEQGDRPLVSGDDENRVIHQLVLPDRQIFCLDLRTSESPQPFLDEVQRLISAATAQDIVSSPLHEDSVRRIDEQPARRWYPVIDFSRCTNCMECIDFCLFGVYGVDEADTILVEQPDNCRKGCPACSRVCPENAIMFPQHKTPAVAGAAFELSGMKIDLSQLFGGNGRAATAAKTALRERDEHLLLAGRKPVEPTEEESRHDPAARAKDDLDQLMDELDAMDL
jgi:Pyruvate/2-oxoacid:ferredoxin oxidoreductase delta subunit